ncbi:unnamed protein product [Peronospora farinosa]|uniref:Uncharacterized protein n=1 Tax=Peronospora farinosa TaxID=134698 RepID=A0AAV0TX17_9STRA|nr:unnamed protein product [Peronospora farinosa]
MADFTPGLWGIYGTVFATLALGFTEGCLEIERHPIPLRFALRFAAVNVLPSTVWSSISARHVAAASGVPLSTLISDTDVVGPRSITIAKRLVLIKSVRALRIAMGSYGLAWSMWCWHKTDPVNSNNDKVEVIKDDESVVRLAPVNSPLSRALIHKHANHIAIVPMTKENWTKLEVNNAVNLKKVGADVKLNREQDQEERVKVIEVELSDIETAVAYAGKLKAQVSRSNTSLLYSVAVLPPYGQPLPTSMMDTFNVCFNPLSAVLTFIASVCYDRGETHVFLVTDYEEGGECGEAEDIADRNANTTRQWLPTSLLATGLLYRHGITTSVVKTQKNKPVDKDAKGEATANHAVDYKSGVVFLIAKSLDAGNTIARKFIDQGIVVQEKTCFIVEESLYSQSAISEESQAQSAMLEKAMSTETEENKQEPAAYFSVADVSDQTLQGIRELLWQGEKPETIQAALYRAYGTQRVVAPTRVDLFSDLDL